jgi:arginine transport system substrate-binding protein
MKKLLWMLVFLFPLTSTFASTLTIGCPPLNPPFGELADGQNHFLGFDVDIMMEICARLGVECAFKPIIFNNLLTALNTGMIDLAVPGVIITPERKADALFSLPYMESSARFMGLVSSNIATPKDIAGKTVGTRQGTPFMELALQLYDSNVQTKEYALTADLLEALKNKEFDVALLDNQAAKYWVGNNSDVYKLIGTPIPIGEGYGRPIKIMGI